MDVGTKIDNYEIIEHIGRGGMADVWSARDTTLGRLVAIKTIARNLASEADPVTMFQQEARTIAGLDHPNILPVFGFGEIKGMFYIAMRFVAGGSLEDELHRSALTYREVVSTGKAVASALDFAHKQSIIHLDLKPPNILLDSQGLPYLADFGLATRLDPSGHAQNPGSGTLLYMAPEQLTSDTLDHRADIYSFGLVLFHMLTGKLPFEAVTPLALKQLQFHEDLPHPADLNPDLPDELGDILRKCTAVNPEERHNTTIELMDAVEAALGSSVSLPEGEITGSSVVAGQSTAFVDLVSMFDPEQVQINEARDIYERARLAWDNGNGRFLLSVTHFMVMSDYFIEAKKHKLSYDEAGAQMLLRGALEYDYHVEQWWSVLNTDSRRWVCMHTVRSESPSARIRAFKRLETLPDDDPPVIPRQVAQALSIENNTESMLVALDVLAFRSKIMGETGYDVKTRYRNRVLGTIAHEGIERIAPDDWKNVTYSQEIDTLVADLALREDEPEIRAKAARTIGKMRSSRAVKHVAEGRKRGEKHTLQALAYILDEVPTLPKNIPFMPRLAAWLMNTGRRLSENPMGIVYAFMFALIGGWLGMGQHIYRLLGQTIAGTAFLESDLWQNTMAGGLFVGFLVAVLAVVSITLPRRLHGFWPLWTRVLWSAIAGYYLAQTVWWTYAWMYLNLGDVPRFIYMLTGAVTAIGLVIPAVLRLRGWSSFLITSLFSFVALCMGTLNWHIGVETGRWIINYDAIASVFTQTPSGNLNNIAYVVLYFELSQVWTIMLPMVLLFSLGIHFPAILSDIRDLFKRSNVSLPALSEMKLLEMEPIAGPATVRLDDVIDGMTGNAEKQKPVATEPMEPMTEEFEVGQVGGTGDTPADTRILASDPNLMTMRKDEMDLHTEEFEVGQVGGTGDTPADTRKLASDPNLMTMRKDEMPPMTEEFEVRQVGGSDEPPADDDRPDWDAIMNPLDLHTEEFEVGQVGGKNEPTTDTEKLASDPNLMTMRKEDMPAMTEEFEVGQVGGTGDTPADTRKLASDPNLMTMRKEDMPPLTEEAEPDSSDDRPDWDAIMNPLNLHTEEFEVGQVGGRGETPDQDDTTEDTETP